MTTLTHTAPAGHRRDLFWIAALVHRLSGVLLACFLPLHFLALALVLTDAAQFDSFIAWTERPLVQAAEAVLVFLLAVHLLGGLRILLIEMLTWRPARKDLVGVVVGAAALVALGFYLGLR